MTMCDDTHALPTSQSSTEGEAWSEAEDPYFVEKPRWPVWSKVLVGAAAVMVVAASGIVIANYEDGSAASRPAQKLTPLTASPAQPAPEAPRTPMVMPPVPSAKEEVPPPPQVAPPSPPTQVADPDSYFLSLLVSHGATIRDAAVATTAGRQRCIDMADNPGRSIGGEAVVLQQEYWKLTLDEAISFVRDALTAYCPQHLP